RIGQALGCVFARGGALGVVVSAGVDGRSRAGPGLAWSCLGSLEAMAGDDVVGEGEPEQDGFDLVDAAHGELSEAPLPEAGVDALAHRPSSVGALAVRASHAPAPGGNAGAVLGPRRIGIALVLVPGGRSVDENAFASSPFGIVVLMEAAVDEMATREA